MALPYLLLMTSQICAVQVGRGSLGCAGGVSHFGESAQSAAIFSHDWSIVPSGRLQSFVASLSQTPKNIDRISHF